MSAAATGKERNQRPSETAKHSKSSSSELKPSETPKQASVIDNESAAVEAEQNDSTNKLCDVDETRSDFDPNSAQHNRKSSRKSRKRKYENLDSDDSASSNSRKKTKTKRTKNSTPKTSKSSQSCTSSVSGKTPAKPNEVKGKKSTPGLKGKSMDEFAGVLGLSPLKNGEHEIDGSNKSEDAEQSLLSDNAKLTPDSKKKSPTGTDLLKEAMDSNSRRLFLERTPESISPGAMESPVPSVKKKRGRPRKIRPGVNLTEAEEDIADCVLELKDGCGVPLVLLEEWEENLEAGQTVDCQICTTNFDTVSDVIEHYRSHHSENNRTTSSADLSESLVKDSYERIRPTALKHLKAVKSKTGSLSCTYCGVLVKNNLDMAVVHHLQCDVMDYDTETCSTLDILFPLLRHFGFIKCQECGVSCHSVKEYKQHVETCGGTEVEVVPAVPVVSDHDEADSVTPSRSVRRRKPIKYDQSGSSGSESESEWKSGRRRESADKTGKRYVPDPELVKNRKDKKEWNNKVDALYTKPDPCFDVPKKYIDKYVGSRKKHLPCPKKCGRSLGSVAALRYHYPRCGETTTKFEMACKKCGAKYFHHVGMRQHVVRCHGLVNPFDVKPNGESPELGACPQPLPHKRRRKKVVYAEKSNMAGSDCEDLDDDRDQDFKTTGEASSSSDDEVDDDSLFQNKPVRVATRLSVPFEGRLSRGPGSSWTYQRCKAFKEKWKDLSGTANLNPDLHGQFVRAKPSLVPDLPGCPAFRLESLNVKSRPGLDVPSLPLFQSVTTTESGSVSTCYMNVGAPAFYPVWRTDSELNCTKYFLLSTLPGYEEKYGRDDLAPRRGLFQVWDCGPLTDCQTLEPRMVLALVHDWGVVLDMRWNAFNIQCFQKSLNSPKTLGYVLVASGDGVAKVFSVPESLLGDRGCSAGDYKDKCYEVKPCAEFVLGESGPTVNPCMSCDWCLHGNDVLVAIGYRSGIVALYDLSTQSPLLVTMETGPVLRPYKTFWAHTKEVRSLRFSPLLGNMLVTAGAEQKLSIWHLDDVQQGPAHSMNKGYVTDLEWSRLDHAIFFSGETTQRLNGLNTCMFYEGPSSKVSMSLGSRLLLASQCAATSVDHSDWLCNTVGGTAEGDVIGNSMSSFTSSRVKYRHNYMISKTEIRPKAGVEQEQAPGQQQQKKRKRKSKKKASQSEDEDSAPSDGEMENQASQTLPYLAKSIQEHKQLGDSYDLVFLDNSLVLPRSTSRKLFDDDDELSLESLDAYPAKTVFKVCWNPNRESCHWLLVARQCGLVSLHNLSGFLPDLDVRTNARDPRADETRDLRADGEAPDPRTDDEARDPRTDDEARDPPHVEENT